METGGLDTIAEISVALAGFSGLAAAFRKRQFSEWTRRERLALWQILNWSVYTLFFALIPSAVLNLDIAQEAICRSRRFQSFHTGILLKALFRQCVLDLINQPLKTLF